MQLFKKNIQPNFNIKFRVMYYLFIFDLSKLIFHKKGNRELYPVTLFIKCKAKVYWDFELK